MAAAAAEPRGEVKLGVDPAEGADNNKEVEDASQMAPPVVAEPAMEAERLAVAEERGNREERVAALRPFDLERKDALWAQGQVVVREYAHAARADRQPGERRDFTETLYWSAGVKTDATTGQATVSFDLNDAVTSFQVSADAFDDAGALGAGMALLQSVRPFYIEPKLPLEVTSGDVIQLPIGLVNAGGSDLQNVTLTASSGQGIDITPVAPLTLRGNERQRRLMEVRIGAASGIEDFILEARAQTLGDRNVRTLSIRPMGFPQEWAQGGMLAANGAAAYQIDIPDTFVPDSLVAKVTVHPTPLASLDEALQRLMREPSGCFEQTSSTSYPLTMAQQYFLTHTGISPDVITRTRELLDKGYARLTSFECRDKGYEWFGGDPGHEALTAYGLMHFLDMSQVRQVDQAMVQRTQRWLMDRRDGKGGFKRNERALDSFGRAPEATTNAYIVWALLESGQKGLDKEIAAVKASAMASDDSYLVALGANVAALAGDMQTMHALCDKLARRQNSDGLIEGGTATITSSGGDAQLIETTALGALAFMRDAKYTMNVENAMKYLSEQCKGGRFGSTQSTVLALRTIVTYDKMRAVPKAPGTVRVLVNGTPVGDPVAFGPQTQGAIILPDIAPLLKPGRHTIELRMDQGSQMPFAIAVDYYAIRPASSEHCKVLVETNLGGAAGEAGLTIEEGTLTEANVVVTNLSREPISMPLAIIGIPGGLEVRHDQLKELVKSGKIAAYEVIGREVVLYWRGLDGGQSVQLPISLVAAIPGSYTGPASRAYQYYTDEFKSWAAGMKVTVTPRP